MRARPDAAWTKIKQAQATTAQRLKYPTNIGKRVQHPHHELKRRAKLYNATHSKEKDWVPVAKLHPGPRK